MNDLRTLIRRRGQRGATLLEALVTLVIVSFGLLGIAGLLLSGVRANTISNSRSIAMMQAYEIGDRMRANINGVIAGAYDNATGKTKDCEPITRTTVGCNLTEQAQFDLHHWNQVNADLLPTGAGIVTNVSAAGQCGPTVYTKCTFQVMIRWDEDRAGAAPTAAQCTANPTRAGCLVLRLEP
jgi:type IV pilus assembly protein PilV